MAAQTRRGPVAARRGTTRCRLGLARWVAWHGRPRLGMARQATLGWAWQGLARRGVADPGRARLGKHKAGEAWHDLARLRRGAMRQTGPASFPAWQGHGKGPGEVGMASAGAARRGRPDLAWHGFARRDLTRHGVAGEACVGKAWQGVASQARPGAAWRGAARHGSAGAAGPDRARLGEARLGEAGPRHGRLDWARRGTTGHGEPRHGYAGPT